MLPLANRPCTHRAQVTLFFFLREVFVIENKGYSTFDIKAQSKLCSAIIFKLFLIVLQTCFKDTVILFWTAFYYTCMKKLLIHSLLINFSFLIALTVILIRAKISGTLNHHGVCLHTTISRNADLGSVRCHKHKMNLIWNYPGVPAQTRA